MRNRRILQVVLLGAILGTTTGCSVFMAMHGKRDANIGALSIGQDRAIVMANLGQPAKTATTDAGRVDIFELQRGNAPSGGRALAHGAIDVFTFGIWELIGTPIEAMQGESYTMTIEYDLQDKVKKVYTGEGQTTGSL